LKRRLPEYYKIFFDNPLFRQRTEGVSILTKEDAIKLGVTGSVLRVFGVKYDVRRSEPHEITPISTSRSTPPGRATRSQGASCQCEMSRRQ
jgi:Ni,Fe-hydrogenase III large subunit